MSNNCPKCDYLLSIIAVTKLKIANVKESNEKIRENLEDMMDIIDELNELVRDLKVKLKDRNIEN